MNASQLLGDITCPYALVPPELKAQNHWVTWKYVPNYTAGKPRKVPVNPDGHRPIDATNSANWLSFQEVVHAARADPDLLIGIVLTGEPCYGGRYLIAIDLDDVPSNLGDEEARSLWVSLGQPYVERSPSGIGLRMFALSSTKLPKTGNAGGGREIYQHRRFMSVTGVKHGGKAAAPGSLKDCTDALKKLVADWWPAQKPNELGCVIGGTTQEKTVIDDTTLALAGVGQQAETSESIARISDMLSYVSADCPYDKWRNVIWSLCSTGWQSAEQLARKWSRSTPERWDESSFNTVVRSFKPGHITLGTLVHIAREGGWHDEGGAAYPAPPYAEPFRSGGVGRLLTIEGLKAIKPEPYRVRGVLPAQGVAAIYGVSGSGKSFLALDLALTVATGAATWFGHKVRPAPVVYVALEGQTGLVNRVKAWQSKHPGADAETIKFLLGDFSLSRADSVQRLIEEVRTAVGTGCIVVVDTLNQASPGSDENSSAEMGTVIAHANAIAKGLEGVVVLIHHAGKDTSRGMRGHSSLFAAMDSVVEVSQDKDGNRSWRATKAKDDALGAVHNFELVSVPLGSDAEGDPVNSCVIGEGGHLHQRVAQPKLSGKRQQAAWDAIQQDGRKSFSRAELEKLVTHVMPVQVGRKRSASLDVITAMTAKGLIVDVGGVLTVQ